MEKEKIISAISFLALSVGLSGCNSNPIIPNIQNQALASSSAYYTSAMKGPSYSVFTITNPGNNGSVKINTVTLTHLADSDNTVQQVHRTANASAVDPIYGSFPECSISSSNTTTNSLSPGQTCEVVIYGKAYNPLNVPATAELKISANSVTKIFNITNTAYLYVGGGINQIGSTPSLNPNDSILAACSNQSGSIIKRDPTTTSGLENNTALSCHNALGDNNTFANYATGYIITLNSMKDGNLYVGGAFNAIGGAVTYDGDALVAKCMPGSTLGCINALGYNISAQFPNGTAKIFGISSDKAQEKLIVTGLFKSFGSASVSGDGHFLVAECSINGDCTNALSTGNSATPYINAGTDGAFWALGMGYNPVLNQIYVSGSNVRQVGNASLTSNNTGFIAACPLDQSGIPCVNPFSISGNPDSNAYGMAYMGTSENGISNMVIGGDFQNLGGAQGGSEKLLANCLINGSVGACSNALSPTGTTQGANHLFTRLNYNADANLLILTGNYTNIYSDINTNHTITNGSNTTQSFPLLCTPGATGTQSPLDCYNPLSGTQFLPAASSSVIDTAAIATQLSVLGS